MAYKNNERATAEINNLMQNPGEFMVAKNAGDQMDESLWRTVCHFITNDHEDEKGWSFNQEAIKQSKRIAGGFTLLTKHVRPAPAYSGPIPSTKCCFKDQASDGGVPHLLEILKPLKVKYENGTWRIDQIPHRIRKFFEKLEIPLPA